MLQSKDIKNLSELTQSFCAKHNTSDFFSSLIGILKLGKLHGIFSAAKTKGFSALSVLEILLCLPFLDVKNISQLRYSSWNTILRYGKDCYYRLMNNPKINWRGFLIGSVKQVVSTLELSCNDLTAFVIDDTTLPKTGYKIEGVSKVWNHVCNKSVLGYQLLVLGMYYGSIFIPIDFSLHREKGKNKRKLFGLKPKQYKKQYRKQRDQSMPSYQRKKELDSSKISSCIKMVKRAIKKGIDLQYILTDSWFSCLELIKTATEHKLIFIGMYSKVKTKFNYNGRLLTYKQLRKLKRKQVKRNRKYNLYYIRTVVTYEDIPVVIYHTRRGKRGKWKVLLSTDISSNFTQTVEVYQIRWSIEVFFKESKQLLGLGKNQSTNFDAQIAATTLTMVQHLFLSIKHRCSHYQTLGGMFKGTKAECLEYTLHQRLIAILLEMVQIIEQLFGELDQDMFITRMIAQPEVIEKLKRLIDTPPKIAV